MMRESYPSSVRLWSTHLLVLTSKLFEVLSARLDCENRILGTGSWCYGRIRRLHRSRCYGHEWSRSRSWHSKCEPNGGQRTRGFNDVLLDRQLFGPKLVALLGLRWHHPCYGGLDALHVTRLHACHFEKSRYKIQSCN